MNERAGSYRKFMEQLVFQGIDEKIIKELMKEYREAKRQHFLEKYSGAILHASKFSELVLALIKNHI